MFRKADGKLTALREGDEISFTERMNGDDRIAVDIRVGFYRPRGQPGGALVPAYRSMETDGSGITILVPLQAACDAVTATIRTITGRHVTWVRDDTTNCGERRRWYVVGKRVT